MDAVTRATNNHYNEIDQYEKREKAAKKDLEEQFEDFEYLAKEYIKTLVDDDFQLLDDLKIKVSW